MIIQKVVRLLWGDLHGTELKKFGLLSLGFFFLIGSWSPLKALKDSIFINLVGPSYLPEAKIISLILLLPLVLFYSKLVDCFSKEKLVYFFTFFYGTIGLIFVYFLAHPVIGIANQEEGTFRLIGWLFYFFVESYISLILALYWSFINDITTPDAAKKGYGLIVFGSQLGGLVFMLFGSYLSFDTSLYARRVPLIVLISALMVFMIAVVIFILQHVVDYNLVGYGQRVEVVEPEKGKERAPFFEGLGVVVSNPYVFGIFGIIFFQEVVSTLMYFQLSLLVKTTYLDPGFVNKFFFDFNLSVRIVSCIFGLIGTSFFHRKLGIRLSLITYPLILGLFVSCYMVLPTLQTVFYVMLVAKALAYALNQPAKEVLYIPTSRSIKYKSKAWIDMFGIRLSKASGSILNCFFGAFTWLVGLFALGMISFWIVLAGVMGTLFRKAIESKKLIK